jgi:hypothetical protein
VTPRRVLACLTLAGVVLAGEPAHADAAADACMTAAERGQELRKQEKLAASRALFQECARAECPAFVRSDCTRWLDEAQGAQPSLVLRVVDDRQNDVRGARVEVDGSVVPDRGDGSAIQVDPGAHRVRVSRDGSQAEVPVFVQEGERDRVVTLRLPATASAPAATVSRGGVPAGAWVLGGIAVASLGGAATLWGLGLHERADLESSCAPQHACSASQVDSSRAKLVAGDVVGGVGVIAAGAAVWFALAGRPQAPLEVGVGLIPLGASLAVVGSY